MAAASKATSPKTGVVAKVASWLMVPNSAEAETVPAEDGGAAADHRDEGFCDIGHADGRKHAGDRRQHRAGKPGQRCADAEGDGIDAWRIDAERRRHVGVLHGAAGDQAKPGPAHGGEDRGHHRYRDRDHEQRIGAGAVGADRKTAERRRDADRGIAEDRSRQPDQKQAQAPGRQHGVDHAAVEKADDGALDDHADDADHDRRHHQHRQPDADAVVGRDDRGIAAEHQKLAMGEIDDTHHAEDDRQPDADQRQAGDGIKDLDCQESNEIHVHPSQARSEGETALRS